jgi:excisionase family DNA binding protein
MISPPHNILPDPFLALANAIEGDRYWVDSTGEWELPPEENRRSSRVRRRGKSIRPTLARRQPKPRIMKRAEHVERVLSNKAVAILGLPLRTVQQLAARGELGAAKLGRCWTFDLEKLRRFVKHREREAWQNAMRQPDATGAPVLSGAALRCAAGTSDGRFIRVTRRLRGRATKRGESG